MKRFFFPIFLAAFVCTAAVAQELTIQSIYAPTGLTGRVPDTIKWSPDGKKVSYFLHQEQGDKADLYYIAYIGQAGGSAGVRENSRHEAARHRHQGRSRKGQPRALPRGRIPLGPGLRAHSLRRQRPALVLHAIHGQGCSAERARRFRHGPQVLRQWQGAFICAPAQSCGRCAG